MGRAEDLAGQSEPDAGDCFDDVVAIARQAYDRGKDGFIRSCRATNEWYTDADVHARGLMSVASDLRDIFLNPEYYGRASPDPTRRPGREEIAEVVWHWRYGELHNAAWAVAKHSAQSIPDGRSARCVDEIYACADAILALREAPSRPEDREAEAIIVGWYSIEKRALEGEVRFAESPVVLIAASDLFGNDIPALRDAPRYGGDGWSDDMEAAPKDGSLILLYGKMRRSPQAGWYIGKWWKHPDESFWIAHSVEVAATRWAPLPPSPNAGGGMKASTE